MAARTAPALVPLGTMWERASLLTLAVNAALQVLDTVTTWLALRAGGIEANPVSRALISIDAWWVVKAVLVALLLAMAWHVHDASNKERAATAAGGGVFAVAMFLVVVQNASIAFA